ncbi:MAG: hypothetical protein ACTSQB_00520 [Candidatus Heimdallarchaeota archaeon]
MLTKKNLQKILIELLSQNELGCTYDFKERFDVSLSSLEALGLMKAIRSKIPTCGEHCERYADCRWLSIFNSRKSKSKFKLTKIGLELATNLSQPTLTPKLLRDYIVEAITSAKIVDIIQLLLQASGEISVEQLITALLEQTNLTINFIRQNTGDILHLLESLTILQQKEGQILPYV